MVDITATPAEGFQFANWTGGVADPNSATTTVTVDADKAVTANFTPITRTLTIAVNGSGTTNLAVGQHSHPHGTVVNITATPAEGFPSRKQGV